MLIACMALSGVAAAATTDGASLEQQRRNFEAAATALKRGQRTRFRKLRDSLQDYPLYPYLLYWELRRYVSSTHPETVRDFLDGYADTPLAQRMRNMWLSHLVRKGKWKSYLDFYAPTDSVVRRCQFRRALLNQGFTEAAFSGIEELWVVGRSQSRACDPLFQAWEKRGGITPELAWQRIALAMDARRVSLARYLRRYVDDKDRKWVDLWVRLYREPQLVTNARHFRHAHPYRERMLLFGIQRLSDRAAEDAAGAWETMQDKYDFTPEQKQSVHRRIAVNLAKQGSSDALAYMHSLQFGPQDNYARAWQIRAALQNQDWEQTLAWIDELSPAEQQQNMWRYWKARSLGETGRQREARSLYSALSGSSSYYSFLAADRLGIPYRLDGKVLSSSEQALADLEQQPGVKRALELLALGRLVDARREWGRVVDGMSEQQLLVAAHLAHERGWLDRTIAALGQTRHRDHLDARFPLRYRKQVESRAQEQGVDPAWVFAVLRQESSFMPDARSPAGALGLMQVMPRTAKLVARRTKTRINNTYAILDEDNNIQLGTAYLRDVSRRFGNSRVLATAAYNAGPHRVKKWIPDGSCLPGELWVEMVPFGETREYLRRVLSYTVIYENYLDREPTRLRERLSPLGDEDCTTMRASEEVSPTAS